MGNDFGQVSQSDCRQFSTLMWEVHGPLRLSVLNQRMSISWLTFCEPCSSALPLSWEAGVGGPWLWAQPELHSETLLFDLTTDWKKGPSDPGLKQEPKLTFLSFFVLLLLLKLKHFFCDWLKSSRWSGCCRSCPPGFRCCPFMDSPSQSAIDNSEVPHLPSPGGVPGVS